MEILKVSELWPLFQMEHNRKSYVEATDRLVCFLDEVTSALQSTSHTAHRRLLESTRYESQPIKYETLPDIITKPK